MKKIEVGQKYKSLIDGKIIEITAVKEDVFYSKDGGKGEAELPSPYRYLDYFELYIENVE